MSDNEESYQGVYSFEPLKAPKLKRGDIDSVRTFFKRYEEYSACWEERQEDGSIEEGRSALSVYRCTDRDLRERIRKYELRIRTRGSPMKLWWIILKLNLQIPSKK